MTKYPIEINVTEDWEKAYRLVVFKYSWSVPLREVKVVLQE
jgi:hypothetical protein